MAQGRFTAAIAIRSTGLQGHHPEDTEPIRLGIINLFLPDCILNRGTGNAG